MPQLLSSRLARSFYKYTFEIRNNGKIVYTHTLLLNPSDMSMDEPPRTNVVQTLGGAYISDFGKGLPNVSISGTTGFHARRKASGDVFDGYTEWKAFRDKVYRYYVETKSTQIEMYWFNWEDSEFYKVVPLSFRLMRSKSEATLYRYELRFVCTKKLGQQDLLSKTGYDPNAHVSTDLTNAISYMGEIGSQFERSGYQRSGGWIIE
jgi:hypothetical protein